MTTKFFSSENETKIWQVHTFAEKLTVARNNAKLSQQALADKLGISVQTYNGYETKGYEPKYELLLKICHILGTSPNELLGYMIDTNYAKDYAENHLFNVKRNDNDTIEYTLHPTFADHIFSITITIPKEKFDLYVDVSFAMAAALSNRCAVVEKERIFIKELEKHIVGYVAETGNLNGNEIAALLRQ